MKKFSHKNKAFTLVEILVVVVIISMLAVFVAPRVFKGMAGTKRKIAKSHIALIESAIEKFRYSCGRVPSDDEGLQALIVRPDEIAENKWEGPYLKKSDLVDPWGNPYNYLAEGEVNPGSFDVVSFAGDGQPGGEGEAADVVND